MKPMRPHPSFIPRHNLASDRFGASLSPHVALGAAATVLIFFGALAQQARAFSATVSSELKAGDIIYTDSGNAIDGGFIVKVSPDTGQQTVLSSGGSLRQPFGVTLDDQGQLIVSDTSKWGSLIRIAPASGQQSMITSDAPQTFGVPFGLALTREGTVLVANAQAVIQVDPMTGQTKALSPDNASCHPLGVTVAGNGGLFVLNRSNPNQILQVSLQQGAWTVVSQGGYLKNLQAIVATEDSLYVTVVATPDGNFGVGRVIRVDEQSGEQTIVSQGGYLVGPVGIAVNDSGQLFVGDPYVINPASPDLYDGGIVRIDPRSGEQSLIVRGHGSIVNPRGVLVVRNRPSDKSAGVIQFTRAE